jgi:hypothetical protein
MLIGLKENSGVSEPKSLVKSPVLRLANAASSTVSAGSRQADVFCRFKIVGAASGPPFSALKKPLAGKADASGTVAI